MKLRVPTLPLARRKPSKLARCVVRDEGGGLGLAAEGVVAGEVVHLDVVHVDVLAGLDVLAREADDLVVLAHRLALRDRPGRDLVAGGDARGRGEALAGHRGVRHQRDPRGHDVVVRVQTDGQGLMLGHGCLFRVDRDAGSPSAGSSRSKICSTV